MSGARTWQVRCDEALCNPTAETAAAVWRTDLLGPPDSPEDPLVAIHLARSKWPKSTAAMIAESRDWLAERGILPVFDLPELNQ